MTVVPVSVSTATCTLLTWRDPNPSSISHAAPAANGSSSGKLKSGSTWALGERLRKPAEAPLLPRWWVWWKEINKPCGEPHRISHACCPSLSVGCCYGYGKPVEPNELSAAVLRAPAIFLMENSVAYSAEPPPGRSMDWRIHSEKREARGMLAGGYESPPRLRAAVCTSRWRLLWLADWRTWNAEW